MTMVSVLDVSLTGLEHPFRMYYMAWWSCSSGEG